MNKRQKKKQLKMRNKKLVKLHPYLLPRSVWTCKVVKGYDYTWTEYDCLYKGWKTGFGKLLLDDLREACLKTNFLNKLQFSDIKEKYGSLRMYNFGAPQEVHDVIRKYEFISQYICYQCGSPESTIVNDYGWYLPMCKCCWDKNNRRREREGYSVIRSWEEVADLDNVGLPNEYKYTTFSKEGNITTVVDISETANKIRRKYNKRRK
jgi:hypothetical protein